MNPRLVVVKISLVNVLLKIFFSTISRDMTIDYLCVLHSMVNSVIMYIIFYTVCNFFFSRANQVNKKYILYIGRLMQ